MRLPDSVTLLRALGLAGILFLIVPVVTVIPLSFTPDRYLHFPGTTWSLRWYVNLFTEPTWYQPLWISVFIAGAVAILAPTLGMLAAYGLYWTRHRIRDSIILLLLLPIFTPPVALAVGLLLIFSYLGLVDHPLGLILAHSLLAMPYAFLILSASLSRANMQLEGVARSLGATPYLAFARVTLPELRASLIIAATLSFLVSFDEPVLALFLSRSRARTLPRQMFDGIRYELDPTVAAVSSILTIAVLLFAVLAVIREHRRDKRGLS